MLIRTCIFIVIYVATSTISHAFCFETAAVEYGVPPELLEVISKHESNNDPGKVHWNTNGTYDYGLMGINTCHEPTLRKYGIPWESLSDPCTNVRVGAWILRKCIDKYGYNWKGIGCYNSQTPDKRDRYARIIAGLLSRKFHLTPTTVIYEITEIQSAKSTTSDNTLLAEMTTSGIDVTSPVPEIWSR